MERSAVPMARAEGACGRLLAPRSGGAMGQQRRRAMQQRRRAPVAPQAGLLGDIFDFESWAPRSSRAWRLGQNVNARQESEDGTDMQEKDVDVLNQRLAAARQSGAAGGPAAEAAAADELAAAAAAAEQSSFLRSTDEEVASALADRIAKVASTKSISGGGSGGSQSVVDGSADGSELTGPQLRDLIFNKWDKTFDLSFVRRDIMGKTLICLNVMWTHLEQRSFPMSEEEYDEKLELIALYLNCWGQAERVEAFLRQPARPRKGMPSKPIMGIAVSIQLDLDDATIDEFFAQGGA